MSTITSNINFHISVKHDDKLLGNKLSIVRQKWIAIFLHDYVVTNNE